MVGLVAKVGNQVSPASRSSIDLFVDSTDLKTELICAEAQEFVKPKHRALSSPTTSPKMVPLS